MSFRINTGVAAITAQRYLAKSQRESEKSLQALASGSRVHTPGSDAAGFAISENLRAQVRGVKMASQNAQNAISLIQTAEGGLNEQNNILVRLRELAVLSASDTVGDVERGFIDKEFQALISEFDRIAKSTRFGNKELLTGTGKEFTFQVGANRGEENTIKFNLDANTQADNAGITGLSIEEQDNALDSLESIDEALVSVADARSTFGAAQSRFQYTIDNLEVQAENLEVARSSIADVDVANEVTKLTRAQILQDIGVSVLAQTTASSGRVIQLLNNI